MASDIPHPKELSAWFHSTFEEALSTLNALVSMSSYTEDRVGVTRVQEYISQFLGELGLTVSLRGGAEAAPTVWAETPGFSAGTKRILLSGHVDTVHPSDDWSQGIEREGDKLIGPGVADMKGGVVLFLWVLRFLADHELLLRLPLRVMLTPDEEIASPSSQQFLLEAAKESECALVFEPGRGNGAVVTERRGAAGLRIEIVGRAAHAGNAFAEGRSAIHQLCHTVNKLFKVNGTIPGANINVGIVSGGTATNTVAERARASVDLRFTTMEQKSLLDRAVERIRTDQIVPDTVISIVENSCFPPMIATRASLALYQQYAEVLREHGLSGERFPLVGGASEAGFLSTAGVPSIDGLGPEGFLAHQHGEYILASSLRVKMEVLATFLVRRFCE